jgi:formylglycine-generating enzyme
MTMRQPPATRADTRPETPSDATRAGPASCCGAGAGLGALPAMSPQPAPARAPSGEDLPRVWCHVPAGPFTMGTNGPDAVPGDGEGPEREVTLEAFEIAATTVTNAEFTRFVRATHYVTDAERQGGSFVFFLQVPAAQRPDARGAVSGLPWWLHVEHASWQRPEGPGSNVRERMGHPVVHVTWRDAVAYCEWAGVRLPSEAEWEKAGRGGLPGRRFAWGDDLLDAGGVPRCNVFRGAFPHAPPPGWQPAPIDAAAGEPNGYGLFNVCGNVWEWCAEEPWGDKLQAQRRPLRGGSFLCHDSYCNRYRVSARSANTVDTATSNIGFRVVRQAP